MSPWTCRCHFLSVELVHIIIGFMMLQLINRMEWPASLVPVWLGGMETYAIIILMTAVLIRASMAHVRY